MKTTLRLTLGIVTVAAVGGFAVLWLAPAEPRFEGRPLGEWLQELISSSEPTRRAAAEVLRRSAPKVVPLLVEMAGADDAEFTKKMKALAESGQLDKAKIAPPSVRRARALNGFRALGAAAAPATPKLTGMLRDTKTSVAASLALACIGGEALDPLLDTLSDPNPRLAGNARTALDSVNRDTPGAAPVLAARLKDKSPQMRSIAARLLGRTAQDPGRFVPLLQDALEDTELDVQVGACFGLGAMEVKSRAALPKLLQLAMGAKEKQLRDAAGGAVWRVDPAEARKAGIDEALIKSMEHTGPLMPR